VTRITDGVEKIILDNGLTLLIKENRAAPVVAIYTYVKVGYFDEPDRIAGISHVIEHMFFKGTKRRGVGQIAQDIKALGGYLNASTIYEHTSYYTVLPSHHFRAGLEIQADALLNSVFDAEELRKEIEVIVQEAKRKWDTPSAVVREKMFELAFTKHRMHRWRIGTEDGLRRITRDDVLDFYGQYYRPENIILVVVGACDSRDVQSAVREEYGAFARGATHRDVSPPEPPQTSFRLGRLAGDILQSYFCAGFHTPDALHPDTYALEVLALILGSGRSSRLYQQVKEERRRVHSIAAYQYSLETHGLFIVEAMGEQDHLHQSEVLTFEELRALQQELVSEEELAKARNMVEAMYFSGMESAASQAAMLAGYEALGDYKLVEDYIAQLYQVTPEDIRAVANRYLRGDNCSLFEYTPHAAVAALKDAGAVKADLAQRLSEAADLPGASPSGSPNAIFAHHAQEHVAETAMEKRVFANGVTLLMKEMHQVQHVAVGLFAHGARSLETEQNAGISWLCARSVLKGTQLRNAGQIAREIEGLGGQIDASAQADYFAVTLKLLGKHITAGFDLFADVILNPAFPEQEIDKEKDEALAQLTRLQDDMFRLPLRLFNRALFGANGYGLPAYGLRDTIPGISRDDLLAWHRTHFSPGNLTFVAVGHFNRDDMYRQIEDRFGSLKQPEKPVVMPSRLRLATEPRRLAEQRNRHQTALVVGFPAAPYLSDDIYPLTVLQNIVSGLGSRFFEELRGKQSLAYAVSAYAMARRLGGAFAAYIATSPEKEVQARQGLLREFEKLTRELVSEEELQRAVTYTIGTHLIGLERVAAQMAQYAHADLLGRGPDEIEVYQHRIASVTREDILRVAQTYFQLDNYFEGVVRGSQAQ